MAQVSHLFSLAGRRILLTGAAGHLGASMARGISAAGGHLLLLGRSRERLESLKVELEQAGGKADVLVCDLTEESQREEAVDMIRDRGGSLHGLVHNAYSGAGGGPTTSRPSDFHLAAELNLIAPFELTRLCLPLLEAASEATVGGASVVHIGSMYGVVSPDPRIYEREEVANPPFYGATKAALTQLTRYLACSLADRRVRVNTISPGPFPAPGVDPTLVGDIITKVPLGRIGEPEEMAGPVVFLLSDAASYVTGSNLLVDGGWTSW